MPNNYMALVEGIIQIFVASIIFITVVRRGKNRLLLALGFLFTALGVFSLVSFLPDYLKNLPVISLLVIYSSSIGNTIIFFGVGTYCGLLLGAMRDNKIIKNAFMFGFFIAFSLIFIHILSLETVNPEQSSKVVFEQVSIWLTSILFIVSLSFISLIFFSLAIQLKKERGAMNYITTTGLGLGLMLIAVVTRRAVGLSIIPINHVLVDILSFVSLGLVVAGAMFQTSFSMSPGLIYDSRTKKPIALAVVRIFRASDLKLVESRITKKDGHYGLLLEKGEYKIDVKAKGYDFPSRQGGYRGEVFKVHNPTVLLLDIPLDPEEG
jgi:hypothetical protein